MFRIVNREPQDDDIHLIEAYCNSLDTKPTGFATGSVCIEVDTSDAYFYDEASSTWIKAGGSDEE